MKFYIVNKEEVVLGKRNALEAWVNSRAEYWTDLYIMLYADDAKIEEGFPCSKYKEDEEEGLVYMEFWMLTPAELAEHVKAYRRRERGMSARVQFKEYGNGDVWERWLYCSTDEQTILDDILDTYAETCWDDPNHQDSQYEELTEYLTILGEEGCQINKYKLVNALEQVYALVSNKRLGTRIESLRRLDLEELENDKIELIIERFIALIEEIEQGLAN